MVMNVSEKIVYNWLIKTKKYKANEIRYQSRTSPDFICEDGKGYEAKRLNGNSITFSSSQIDNLEKNNSIIVVTDNEKGKIIKVFLYADIKKITFPKVYFKNLKNITAIQILKETQDMLKQFGIKAETYDSILRRLMKEAKHAKK